MSLRRIQSLFAFCLLLSAVPVTAEENVIMQKLKHVESTTRQSIHRTFKKEAARVRFPVGQSQLTDSAKLELQAYITETRERGESESLTVAVAVWPDRVPAKGKTPAPEQVQLVADRLNALRTYLESDLKASVARDYNMADFASAALVDAETQKRLGKAGGGPQTAVVWVP